MTDTILEFPKPASRPSAPSADTGFRLLETEIGEPIAPITERLVRGSAAIAPIEIDKLYPATEGTASDVLRALGLLADGIGILEQARSAISKDDPITADRCLQRLQVLVAELFGCRRIGDGFALIINSLHFAFINQQGKIWSIQQITTVWRGLKSVRNRPFVPFNEALEYVSELESCGFQVDPPILSELLNDNLDE